MGNRDFLKMKAPAGYKAGIGRGATPFGSTSSLKRAAPASDDADEGQFDDAPVADDRGLLSGKVSRDDVAAEKIWQGIESRRHRRKQESAPQVSMTTAAKEFADLKGSLAAVSDDAWLALPEASDMTRKNKRLREEERETRRTYALPDSMLLGDDEKANTAVNVERMRPVLEQLVRVEPQNPHGWISLANLENDAMRPRHAKAVINKGCQKCPDAPEVWLESIKLHSNRPAEARSIAARALCINPKSRELWDRAVELETDSTSKLQVVHKALENLPSDGEFWALASDLEVEEADKKAVLDMAVELCPSSANLWTRLVALSKDKPPVVEKALAATSIDGEHLDHSLLYLGLRWTTDPSRLKELAEFAADVTRDDRSQWLADIASLNENETATLALVEALHLGPNDLDQFFNLAQNEQQVLLDHIPQNETIYLRLTEGRSPYLKTLLQEAVTRFPRNFELWARYIKNTSVDEALKKLSAHKNNPELMVLASSIDPDPEAVLAEACNLHPMNARVWYKFIHRLRVNKKESTALDAIEVGSICNKSSAKLHLQRYQLGDPHKAALELVSDADPLKPALWLEVVHASNEKIQQRAILSRALKALPKSELLWLHRLRLEPRGSPNATSLIAQALQECPHSGILWYEDVLNTPSAQRKRRLADAIAATQGAAQVLLAAALHCYATDKKIQGDQFMQRALEKDKDDGDIWMWAYRFGIVKDTQTMPHHGIEWPSIFKAPKNAEQLDKDWTLLIPRSVQNPFRD